MNYLKPVREIIAQLNQLPEKPLKVLIHGVGRIKNVVFKRYHFIEHYGEIWIFLMKLDNGITIKCETSTRWREFLYFEEGDYIEFFGQVDTRWFKPRFLRCDVESIEIYDAKLSEEKRCFSEVFVWNARKYEFYNTHCLVTSKDGGIESKIECIGKLEPQENTWLYGQLFKTRNGYIVLESLKIITT